MIKLQNKITNYISFLIVAVIFASIGFGFLIYNKVTEKDYLPTLATISHIYTYYDDDDDVCHEVYVNYEVDGITYTDVKINSYYAGMQEGQQITIFYNKYNPEKTRVKKVNVVFIIFAAVGSLILTVVIVMLAKDKRKSKEQKFIISSDTSKKHFAQIYDIALDPSYLVNGRAVYSKFTCQYNDSGVVKTIKSKRYKAQKSDVRIGDIVDVYTNDKYSSVSAIDYSSIKRPTQEQMKTFMNNNITSNNQLSEDGLQIVHDDGSYSKNKTNKFFDKLLKK